MKQSFTILWPHKVKNHYLKKQDNEVDTQGEAENHLFHVSSDRQTETYRQRFMSVVSFFPILVPWEACYSADFEFHDPPLHHILNI